MTGFCLFLSIDKYGGQRDFTLDPKDGASLTARCLSVLERMVRHFLHLWTWKVNCCVQSGLRVLGSFPELGGSLVYEVLSQIVGGRDGLIIALLRATSTVQSFYWCKGVLTFYGTWPQPGCTSKNHNTLYDALSHCVIFIFVVYACNLPVSMVARSKATATL
jgi:hypothetical protein